VFTLTGSEIPDQMSIQIMTIRGIVVKEITQAELGPIRIGNNITEYAWDGRDQYGDLLANGVYFYRVVTKMNGEKVDHRAESFDKYFKKGFGKMVMIR
jgi:flagellar hook assembly protein FlgD